jgi:DNA-binding IscR family transcriptional regulator
VVEVDDATAAVFRAADSRLSASQIAEAISLSPEFVQQTLAALVQIGALVTSS